MWCKELTHLKRPWCWENLKGEEKGTREDEMVGWHHQLYGHEFEHAPGVGGGQGSLACCSPWGYQESDRTKQPNWNWEKILTMYLTKNSSGICKEFLQISFKEWTKDLKWTSHKKRMSQWPIEHTKRVMQTKISLNITTPNKLTKTVDNEVEQHCWWDCKLV